MPSPISEIYKPVSDLLANLALELNFVEAGKDAGLLPINSFLGGIEDFIRGQTPPAEILGAVQQARQWIDKLFDTTAVFDAPTIARLGEWQAWMASAVKSWEHQQPCPTLPSTWGNANADAMPEQELPDAASNPPSAHSPSTAEPSDVTEPVLSLTLEADKELLREFINESQEHLQNIENGVLVLEENPSDADTLNSIFRAFHTFKGGSGFLNLTPIKNLAHELESLLDAARQHKLAINTAIIDVILQGGDTLKAFTAKIAAQLNGTNPGQPIVVPTLQLIAEVKSVLSGESPAAPAPTLSLAHGFSQVTVAVEKAPAASAASPTVEAVKTAPIPNPPDTGLKPGANESALAANAPAFAGTSGSASPSAPSAPAPAITAAGFVKVDTTKLDSLIDLVGELVISESMVVQDPDLLALPSRNLARKLAQLRRITSELQRTAMSLRMVPIRATFQKMNRLVRDLAAKQQKQVQLVFSGEDTELDRNIVEEISDPLVHMIRNAADHGVEKPDSRIAKGKPAVGTIHLRAFHRGGNIVIQIQDDGNGLDKERLLGKAREKGIVKPGQNLSDKEICDLIFAPGFSTAEQITEISGRGVGMDVVRRNIEKLRGKVEIDTVAGQGTTFTIYLPLTLAIIDGMIVSVGSERYVIPTLTVRESFRPTAEMISTFHGVGEVVNVRGKLCPLLRLYEHFDQPSRITDPTEGIVVVVEAGGANRCLLVDELIGKQEVVIKSLGETFKKNPALAGAAILGDGQVGLILEVNSLVQLSRSLKSQAA